MPVIGIVQAGEQFTADRLTYVPGIGIVVLMVWALADSVPAAMSRLAAAASLTVVAAAAATTRTELSAWRNSRVLCEHALALTSENHVAEGNLGLLLMNEGRAVEAFPHLERAVQRDRILRRRR